MDEQLVTDNMGLVYSVIRKHFPTFVKDADIVQCGNLGLCKAANTWDESKSAFTTYAYKCIYNEIAKEFRDRCKHTDTLSLDYETTNSEGDTTTFGDLVIGESDVEFVDLDGINQRLNSREQEIFKLKLSGMSTKDIGDAIGCPISSVRACLRKVKILLREDAK